MTNSRQALAEPSQPTRTEITLAVLKALHENSAHTQRTLAQELGVALGLVNAYLKRCIHKGYIKVSQIPPRRYAYYLTPTGFNEKTRLTGEFLRQSFKLMREARQDCSTILGTCAQHGWKRIALFGLSDLTDIILLSIRETDLTITAIIDAEADVAAYHGIPVQRTADGLADRCDAAIICDMTQPQRAFDVAHQILPAERVLPLPLLELDAPPPAAD